MQYLEEIETNDKEYRPVKSPCVTYKGPGLSQKAVNPKNKHTYVLHPKDYDLEGNPVWNTVVVVHPDDLLFFLEEGKKLGIYEVVIREIVYSADEYKRAKKQLKESMKICKDWKVLDLSEDPANYLSEKRRIAKSLDEEFDEKKERENLKKLEKKNNKNQDK
jgi:hypothetical protein